MPIPTRLWLIGNNKQPILPEKFFDNVTEPESYDLFGIPSSKMVTFNKVNKDLQAALNYLYSPFSKNKSLVNISLSVDGEEIKSDFSDDVIKLAETKHSFSLKIVNDELFINAQMHLTPWFIERVHSSEIKSNELFDHYKLKSLSYAKLLKKYERRIKDSLNYFISIKELLNNDLIDIGLIKPLLPITGKIFSFKRDSKYLKLAITSALENSIINRESQFPEVRGFLNIHNGVKLYRNDYRVGTLGNNNNDWLKFQQKRTTGQQFYRFDLGNCIGYVNINDPLQEIVTETSSRESIVENPHTNLLLDILDEVFNKLFYLLTVSANTIIKGILSDEGLIPKNDVQKVKNDITDTEELYKRTQEDLKVFHTAIKKMKKNIEMETPEQVSAVKEVILTLDDVTNTFNESISISSDRLKDLNKYLITAEENERRIETEAYNNYKLMANGLITETITHELHSIISNASRNDNGESKFEEVRDFLIEKEAYTINNNCLTPLKNEYQSMFQKIGNLNVFYRFLEKTFIYKGTIDDFELINLKKDFLEPFCKTYMKDLVKHNIEVIYDNTDLNIFVPGGSLMHLFYNLFTNSIYWINERRRRASKEDHYKSEVHDSITITKNSDNTILIYDTGTGVLPNMRHTLFLQQESGKLKGRGMGLYIVKQFLSSFDSKIELLEEANQYNNPYIFEVTFNKIGEFDNE